MDLLFILLRLIHIFAGVFWVGAAWIGALFLEPTARALGPDGGKFLSHMATVRRYSIYIMVSAVLTILAGWGLWFMRYGMPSLGTSSGLAFFIGGIAGLIAMGIGAGTGSAATGMTRLGSEIAQQGKPPTPEQQGQMRELQGRMRQFGIWTAVLTSIALFLMAIAPVI
ncbi:MAG: hypothetical protein IT331_12110 [Anaerolineae bacterium]|nr:hypothetical protein [Anaerolineae bacterium]